MGYVPPSDNMGASVPSMIDLYEKGRLTKDELRRLGGYEFNATEVPSMWNGFTMTVAIASLCFFSFGIGCWVGQMQGLRLAESMQTLEKAEQ